MIDRPFFLSNEVCLSPLNLYVVGQYREWFNNSELPAGSLELPKTETQVQDWLIKITRSSRNKHFSILIKGKNIGHIGLKEIDRTNKKATLDLFLVDPSFWESNLAKGIFNWLKFFARSRLGLKKIYINRGFHRNRTLTRFLTPSGFVEDDQGESLAFWVDL